MAVNQIKTRILNKYDSLTNWNKADTFYPRAGEICLANLGTQQIMGANGETRYEPIIGIKVGIWDGVANSETQKSFKDLQWVQAIAGDVSSFLKGLNKQEDFDAYVKNLINTGYITDVTKDIESLIGRVTQLEGTVNDTTTGVAAINTRLTSIDGSISTINGSISTISGNITSLTNDKADKTKVATDIAAAKTAVLGQKDGTDYNGTVMGAYEAAAAAAASANTANTAIGSTDYTGGTLTAAIKALQDAVGDSSEGLGLQVANLQTRMGEAETAIGTKAAQADLETLQGRVTTVENDLNTATTGLKAKVATVEGKLAGIDTTVVAKINASEEAINAQIKAITDDYLKAADKQALQTQIDTIMSNPDAEGAINSINEFTQYVKDHGAIADGFRLDINGLKTKVDTGDLTVSAYVSKALEDSKLDQYASAEAFIGVEKRVKAIEDAPYATTANVATAKSEAKNEIIGASGDAKTADTIYGAKAYAKDYADTVKSEAISDAAGKYELKNVAKGLVDALAGEGNTSTVKANADNIASLNSTVKTLVESDGKDGIVSALTQNSETGKISVTHKKITMDDMAEKDPADTSKDYIFIFDCGNASRDA